ncbi:CsbD family protein [Scrofimicrobium sp. R131]|uniref:CsbD family protein n=1 Tax=Scrofimicrobium appendicitidis TaxID=3079930 RepID=A0AAU7V6S5_9ACTO
MTIKDKFEAEAEELKGKATEAIGRVTKDDEKIGKGEAEQLVAKGKKVAEQVKDVFKK